MSPHDGESPIGTPAASRPFPDLTRHLISAPPLPTTLTDDERQHLLAFDQMDFEVFTHAQWARLHESHADNVRVHWPDGHYTDGLDKHIADLSALHAWAPDCTIAHHPLRIAKDEYTCVIGTMTGTFSRPMTQPSGAVVQPTGRAFSISMVTIGIWNARGVMDEEFLFWDNDAFFTQIGLGR